MLKKSTFAALLLVVMACTCFRASAQFTYSCKAWNGWNKIIVKSTLSGLDSGKTYYVNPIVGNNLMFAPVMAYKLDSFVATSSTRTLMDTLYPSIPNPVYLFVKSIATVWNSTKGAYDTAGSIVSVPVLPAKKPVTQTFVGQSPTSKTVNITVTQDPGNDTCDVFVCGSFGDTVNTIWFPCAVRDSIFPAFGSTTQAVTKVYTMPVGFSGKLYSFFVLLKPRNGGKTDTIGKYTGKTLLSPTPGTTTTLQNAKVNKADSITGDYYANTNNIAGSLTMYSQDSATGKVDSSVVTFAAGSDVITAHQLVAPVSQGHVYYEWATLRLPTTSNTCAKTRLRVANQTFSITPDTSYAVGVDSQRVVVWIDVPDSSQVNNLTFIADYYPTPSYSVPFFTQGYPTLTAGRYHFSVTIPNLVVGTTYVVSPFGCANNGSNWINPGDVKIIFTFMGMTTSIVQVENGDKPRVYPNPAVGKLFIENVKEYIFYNPISQAVVSQQKNCNSRVEVSLENVPQGMYILKTDHGTEKVLVQ